jgi:enoyl-CoA hydratase/carnithine racemase
VTRVLPAGEVLDAALATARKLAERPAASVNATRMLMRRTTQAAVDDAVATEAGHFLSLMHSPAAKEAFAAFLEKRKPDFSRVG